ncbi:Hypothetical protein LUCI_1914 [Lucifera butyrica]|uniref:EF2563 family selenium-dependent molybdenum hydroxylase system protein n=1 Tax=Lucifera butyrica TaxID=1351585 RepID=A0A498RC06_9FIRM|nr:selenium-dependent molybdenum cofactor biosynthesis protein YqeB [Lucifera butyrica]VBB06678.1 Hypothetical protein LUCI_1914 [Lucifera butyrica]
MSKTVIIKGAGDIATGIACRLYRSGFRVVMTEIFRPTVIRRTVAFAEAVYEGRTEVEGITAVRTEPDRVEESLDAGLIPVLVDPEASSARRIACVALVDAILAKKNTGTALSDAPVVIAIGPGFIAGKDVHAVIETMRGHYLGRVILAGSALPNTGAPGEIGGYTVERVLRAPAGGIFRGLRRIGDAVRSGDAIAMVDGQTVPATIDGILRGLLHDGLKVYRGMKIGDIDPRCKPEHCFSVSDKARAVGGGVLEAILSLTKLVEKDR